MEHKDHRTFRSLSAPLVLNHVCNAVVQQLMSLSTNTSTQNFFAGTHFELFDSFDKTRCESIAEAHQHFFIVHLFRPFDDKNFDVEFSALVKLRS